MDWKSEMNMSSSVWSKGSLKERFTLSPPYLLLAITIALLVGGMIGILESSLAAEAVILAVIIAFRQDELAATSVIVVSIYYDWYQASRVIALILVSILLIVFYLNRSPQRPWVEPRIIWLWALFLALAISPAIRGALTVHDIVVYYPSVVFGALIMFWLGTVIARNPTSVRRFFKLLSFFAVLIAVHTIIQATTGITLLQSSTANDYLASRSYYSLSAASNVARVGSFFIQPDFNSIFLAMMILIPIGLFAVSTSVLKKILYLAEIFIFLTALLFTYSIGSWLAAIGGVTVYSVLVGRNSYRVLIPLLIIIATMAMFLWFPSQVNLLLQHASDPAELALRNAVWLTAWRVILAYPLTGIGLGHRAYLVYAEPFRAVGQVIPYDHPHNSYLEWGAMAGLPVLLVFLALLAFALWQALGNWVLADVRTRSLLGAGIAAIIALSINSLSIDGWTLAPIAATGWLILGVISSPLLRKSLDSERKNSKASNS
jgi:O-antigen ligase